ncbi:hypothetical protein A2344_01265 [Candidatus Peregrinibacteria bacterium RIFOXYB12_FULL_41_12]|nr:MAG: hypothetical protein A2344_01265 [Candidatus Peregrinibacteria bacterium RIFOXYB12_FULL_41_12]OGJ48326.1 MAG: hypothetical protein A2244_02320 [Candidatus Peregrinibacteria bacterium RIFOXYA2_FULL_41_18]OGJ52855.1 MAG: hypothetical protein A2448_04610 [Candidatus Peregrinibacteria bacterium RIFOXYC2_FULL_41_22]OGJ54038.1 MAG: hypothetical protein A2336_00120 [Candidatus Peregrinibacteria bacterium RIFOXYB2_FULL_41_88]
MKKTIIWILAVLTLWQIPTSAFAVVTSDDSFSDLSSDDPSIEAIEWMRENGIVEGYQDGTFQSLNKINRAEFMKIVVESITDEAAGSNCFLDVADEWFAKYVCYGKEMDMIDGYDDGTFKPANEINFAEASKIITNALGLEPTTITESDPWYKQYVEPIAEAEAIPTSISDLDKEIARGEMAEVIWRIEEQPADLASLKYEELEGEVLKVSSCDELKTLFLSNPPEIIYYAEDEMDVSSADSSGSSDSESVEYSTTNVQVSGVDEADIVKNDGEYIYVLKDSYDYDYETYEYSYDYSVRIIHAYPSDELTEVSKITFDPDLFNPYEMYLDGDQLTVIGYAYTYDYTYDYGFDIYYPYYHSSRTVVYTYDISDRTSPTLTRALSFDGDYSDSRKVDNTLYLVMNKFDFDYSYDPETLEVEELLPRYYDSNAGDSGEEQILAQCTDISYMPQTRDWNYLIAVAIPLADPNGEIDKEVIVGDSENIYSSTDNLYVASTNYDSDDYYYDWNNAKTLVHKFSLTSGEIEYGSSGKVQGTILNQFSMDEHDNYFRIATTKGDFWDVSTPSTNNLYVLDSDMNTVGSVEGLAAGEELYSTRFIGDRGYLVTFKKVDPLFVVDLSDPTSPTVLGELKIPGFSDYLHPYDENHIIGFGKDAEEASVEEEAARGLDFAWYQGLKVSLFDVTDPANPVQEYSIGIGDRGTDSELLYDHKALLFDAAKNLLAFPVTLAELADETAAADTYGEYVYQGEYVYSLDLETGFTLKGTVSHYADGEYSGDWYDNEKEVSRALYIGDNLYTVSEYAVKVNDLNTMEEIGEVLLD